MVQQTRLHGRKQSVKASFHQHLTKKIVQLLVPISHEDCHEFEKLVEGEDHLQESRDPAILRLKIMSVEQSEKRGVIR